MSGHLYYDEAGRIKTVALRPLAATPFRHLRVTQRLAEKFLRGELKYSLSVDFRTRHPRLEGRTEPEEVDFQVGDYTYVESVHDVVAIIIQYATETNEINFSLFGNPYIAHNTNTVTFYLASKRDRTDVRSCFSLDLNRILDGQTVTWPLPCPWTDQLTLIHPKIISLGTIVEKVRYLTSFVPINGRDYSCRVRIPRHNKNPLLICKVEHDKISICWGQKGGRLYDRQIKELPFFVTRRGDPSFLIDEFTVDLDQLRDKDVVLNKQYPKDIDLYTLMYFADMIHF